MRSEDSERLYRWNSGLFVDTCHTGFSYLQEHAHCSESVWKYVKTSTFLMSVTKTIKILRIAIYGQKDSRLFKRKSQNNFICKVPILDDIVYGPHRKLTYYHLLSESHNNDLYRQEIQVLLHFSIPNYFHYHLRFL